MKRHPHFFRSTFARGFRYSALPQVLSLVLLALCGEAATPSTVGQPPASGREPATQAERDWVDNRWGRTEVGRFLASNLDLPGGKIAKGLAIKVGDQDGGTVAFDTAQCAWRGGWLGSFVQVDSARFGLLHAPRVVDKPLFTAPSRPGWINATSRYSGLHLHGKRVVLEYVVGEARVLDSPWLEKRGELQVFTRSLQLGPSRQAMKLQVAAGGGKALHYKTFGTVTRLETETEQGVLVILLQGATVQASLEMGTLFLSFAPHETALKVKLHLWAGDRSSVAAFDAATLNRGGPENLENLLAPGPAQWLPELKTTGQRGANNDFLAVDTLSVPYDNPWKALMFLAGVDFTPDGSAYVCSIHGDVWRVTGINDTLGELRWKRFATGLFQPLGLKVREGRVYVLGRDQVTRLHDLDGDGEADYYENFCNLIDTSTGGHDYVTSLEMDEAGHFYFVDPRGAHRISADGKRLETLGTGFRNPNGLGVSPDGGILTVAPQQGEWTPSSMICEVKPGGYYGYGGPKTTTAERPFGYDLPLCWIPHSVDNSSGSQVWVPAGQWGALGGNLLHLLWGRCSMMLVLRDVVGGVSQGAVVPLPARFLAGPNRASFHPRDGHLYIAGSTGWQTSAVKDGALQRVRLTGKPMHLPLQWHAHTNGLTLTFSEPLERTTAEDIGSYAVHRWNYRYAAQYGSKDWSPAQPDLEGREEVTVKSARLLPDGKTVFLELNDLKPVMQMEVKYSLNAARGKSLRNQLWLTLNRLDVAHK